MIRIGGGDGQRDEFVSPEVTLVREKNFLRLVNLYLYFYLSFKLVFSRYKITFVTHASS